mgnify:CR=1 FL=1
MSEQSNYPTTNSGSEYFNINICRSFMQPVTRSVFTSLQVLSGADVQQGWVCSEVLIKNRSNGVVAIYGKDFKPQTPNSYWWQMEAGDEFTFRGLTNVNEISAFADTGVVGEIFYRTQYYSSNPIR